MELYRRALAESEAVRSKQAEGLTAKEALDRRYRAGELTDEEYGAEMDVIEQEYDLPESWSVNFSISNTRNMTWRQQMDAYFKNKTLKSSDSLYLGNSSVVGIQDAPLYIPTSVVTKAMRPKSGSRSAHELTEQDIRQLESGVNEAPVVIHNPARNAVVYVTNNQDKNRNYIILSFDLNNNLYGEVAHKATSIHGHADISAMLQKLGADATVFVNDENKLNQMLPGDQILKSLALLARVELVGQTISQSKPPVNPKFSISEPPRAAESLMNASAPAGDAKVSNLDTEAAEPMTKERADAMVAEMPAKAQEALGKTERHMVNALGVSLNVPKYARREYLMDIARQISGEVLENGTVSNETLDRLFETAWEHTTSRLCASRDRMLFAYGNFVCNE